MTINEMIKEMEQNGKEVAVIGRELRMRKSPLYDILVRQQKYTQEFAIALRDRVVSNYRKAQITEWYRESKVAVRRARRIMDQYKASA